MRKQGEHERARPAPSFTAEQAYVSSVCNTLLKRAEAGLFATDEPEDTEKRERSAAKPAAEARPSMVRSPEEHTSKMEDSELGEAPPSPMLKRKSELKYTQFHVEEESEDEAGEGAALGGAQETYFQADPIASNPIRMLHACKGTTFQAARRQTTGCAADVRLSVEKQRELKKLGGYSINYQKINKLFDSMRLKIIMLEKQKANCFGKNPDYYFAKGVDYLNVQDFSNAIQCFQKGVHDKHTHLLCRFNLGYVLFKVGHFPEAANQYHILAQQCLELRIHPAEQVPLVLFNKAASELQAGLYSKVVESAQLALDALHAKEKGRPRTEGGPAGGKAGHNGQCQSAPRARGHVHASEVIGLKDRELIIALLTLQGLAYFKLGV